MKSEDPLLVRGKAAMTSPSSSKADGEEAGLMIFFHSVAKALGQPVIWAPKCFFELVHSKKPLTGSPTLRKS